MIPIRDAVLTRLRLEEAVRDEAQSWQSLIPPAPGWDQLETNAATFASWLKSQLSVGFPLARNVIMSAQKPTRGIRPLPIWGFAERVIYRALVDFILRNEEPLDRSVEAYRSFISAPLSYAISIEPETSMRIRLTAASSIIQYVVKTDVTAFYDYIDHEVLARELLVRTGDNEAISCLISLLSEIQGRTYGIPQLLDPSDRLSEIYIDIVERFVLRRGWPAWRFNDDFRIATRSFSDALAAIEDIAEAMRDIGLTLSDSKTKTPRYSTYVFEAIGLSVDDEVPDEMHRILTGDTEDDYIEGVDLMTPEQSLRLIERTYVSDNLTNRDEPDGIDLRDIKNYDFRQLRRSLGQLIRTNTLGAMAHMVKLISYVHALTPWIIRYVSKMGAQQTDEAAAVLDEIIAKTSLNDWQRIWIARAIDELNLLDSGSPGDPSLRAEWMKNLRHARHSPAVAAEATLALSTAGLISFSDLDYALREEPIALSAWYISAIGRLNQLGMVTSKEYAALQREGGLFSIMLPRQSS